MEYQYFNGNALMLVQQGWQGYYPQQRQSPVVVQAQPRIQAILSAGAVLAACDRVSRKMETAANEAVKAAMEAIQPLPVTTDRKFVRRWFSTKIEEFTVIPTEEQQRQHRQEMEKRAQDMAGYYRPSAQIKTLAGLAAHYSPDQPMPLEGEYVTAIAEYLEPTAPTK